MNQTFNFNLKNNTKVAIVTKSVLKMQSSWLQVSEVKKRMSWAGTNHIRVDVFKRADDVREAGIWIVVDIEAAVAAADAVVEPEAEGGGHRSGAIASPVAVHVIIGSVVLVLGERQRRQRAGRHEQEKCPDKHVKRYWRTFES